MANLAALSDQDLFSEANLAADLTREAPNPQAEAEAQELLDQLLLEISRREQQALQEISPEASYQELVGRLFRTRRQASVSFECSDRCAFEAAQAHAERLETELNRRVYEAPF